MVNEMSKHAVHTDVAVDNSGREIHVCHVMRDDETWHDMTVVSPLSPDDSQDFMESVCECEPTIEYVEGRSDLVLVIHNDSC